MDVHMFVRRKYFGMELCRGNKTMADTAVFLWILWPSKEMMIAHLQR